MDSGYKTLPAQGGKPAIAQGRTITSKIAWALDRIGCRPHFNIDKQSVVYNFEGRWIPATDRLEDAIEHVLSTRFLVSRGKPLEGTMRQFQKAVSALTHYNQTSLAREWIESCRDAEPRPLEELFDCFDHDKSDYTRYGGRLLMLNLVNRLLVPECPIRKHPVLRGLPATGKSTFVRHILPDHLREMGYHQEHLNFNQPNEQKLLEAVMGVATIEVTDMMGLTSDRGGEAAKGFSLITAGNFRQAYARRKEKVGLICSMVGTTNTDRKCLPSIPSAADKFYILNVKRGEWDPKHWWETYRENFVAEAVRIFEQGARANDQLPGKIAKVYGRELAKEMRGNSDLEHNIMHFLLNEAEKLFGECFTTSELQRHLKSTGLAATHDPINDVLRRAGMKERAKWRDPATGRHKFGWRWTPEARETVGEFDKETEHD